MLIRGRGMTVPLTRWRSRPLIDGRRQASAPGSRAARRSRRGPRPDPGACDAATSQARLPSARPPADLRTRRSGRRPSPPSSASSALIAVGIVVAVAGDDEPEDAPARDGESTRASSPSAALRLGAAGRAVATVDPARDAGATLKPWMLPDGGLEPLWRVPACPRSRQRGTRELLREAMPRAAAAP